MRCLRVQGRVDPATPPFKHLEQLSLQDCAAPLFGDAGVLAAFCHCAALTCLELSLPDVAGQALIADNTDSALMSTVVSASIAAAAGAAVHYEGLMARIRIRAACPTFRRGALDTAQIWCEICPVVAGVLCIRPAGRTAAHVRTFVL